MGSRHQRVVSAAVGRTAFGSGATVHGGRSKGRGQPTHYDTRPLSLEGRVGARGARVLLTLLLEQHHSWQVKQQRGHHKSEHGTVAARNEHQTARSWECSV